jgi:hypothetical protein
MSTSRQHPFKLFFLLIGLSIELSLSGILTPAFAQSNVPVNSLFSFKPPEDDAPEQTVGGGSRPSNIGLCPQDRKAIDKPFTALLSSREQAVTLASRPTVFVYLPETEAKQVSLTVANATESYYYEKIIDIDRQSGIVGISLPEDAPPLSVGETYLWSLTILCSKTKRPSDPFVSGNIQRITVATQSVEQLEASSWQERVSFYEANNIWYDALKAVANWKQEQPKNPEASARWIEILQDVGLGQMSEESLFNRQ